MMMSKTCNQNIWINRRATANISQRKEREKSRPKIWAPTRVVVCQWASMLIRNEDGRGYRRIARRTTERHSLLIKPSFSLAVLGGFNCLCRSSSSLRMFPEVRLCMAYPSWSMCRNMNARRTMIMTATGIGNHAHRIRFVVTMEGCFRMDNGESIMNRRRATGIGFLLISWISHAPASTSLLWWVHSTSSVSLCRHLSFRESPILKGDRSLTLPAWCCSFYHILPSMSRETSSSPSSAISSLGSVQEPESSSGQYIWANSFPWRINGLSSPWWIAQMPPRCSCKHYTIPTLKTGSICISSTSSST